MSAAIEVRGKRRSLIFDVDGSQYAPGGSPCTLCGCRQDAFDDRAPRAFVRVREKVDHGSVVVAQLCPDCIARAVVRVDRHQLWAWVSRPVQVAILAMVKRYRVARRSAGETGER